MKIQLYSDLHLEHQNFEIPKLDSDLIILAGDIHTQDHSIHWLIEQDIQKPILYVLGNHEFYGTSYPELINNLKRLSAGTNIHILEENIFEIKNYRFLGCTLWTDYQLYNNKKIAQKVCEQVVNDHRRISRSQGGHFMRASDLESIHNSSILWLKDHLQNKDGKKNIIISHHAPSMKSIASVFKEDIITAAFASNLEPIIKKYKPDLWFHGHTHHHSDYQLFNTRIIANPRGYPNERNVNFIPDLIIEI